MSDPVDQPGDIPAAGATVRWSIRLLALAACGVTGYLLWVSLAARGLPAGCGSGSGCEEVLASRWSAVFGVPVSAPAISVYLGVLVASLFVGPPVPAITRRCAWAALVVLAAAIAAAAVWFIGLQALVLGAFCPWCMADHALGLALAGLILWQTATGARVVSRNDEHADTAEFSRIPLRKPWLGVLPLASLGVLLVAGLIVSQIAFEYKPQTTIRLPAGKNADTGPGPNRAISVLNGDLQLAPHEEPTLGSPDAPKLLVVLFDYCCPHCRAAHGYLLTGLERYRGQMGVVLLPMPLDGKCNPDVEHTEPRFEHACELARLALAVWRADRTKFAEFDRWLFGPETASEEETWLPRNPGDAHRLAEQLVTATALEKALADPWIDEHISRHVQAYARSGAERIPVIMSPGFDTLVGRPGSAEELFEVLEKELGLKPEEP
jgi:uncharacterized membrane protein/protein-disulfide isomerase